MDIAGQRKIATILRVLADAGKPIGSIRMAAELKLLGVDIKHRMIRYYLAETDRTGLTRNLGRRGREITEKGRRELSRAVAVDKVGFVAARVDELAYKMSFDLDARRGTIIINVSTVPKAEFARAAELIARTLDAGLGMGRHVALDLAADDLAGRVPQKDRVALGTVCSVTFNGVLGVAGITTASRFGGLVELKGGRPLRFTELISYEGSTLDPLEIFIQGRMTSVREAVETGSGVVGASFREMPAAALPRAMEIFDKLAAVGLGRPLVIGRPSQPLLDVPVPQGRVGFVVAGGINPLGAVEEAGIATESHAMAALCEFRRLVSTKELRAAAGGASSAKRSRRKR